MGCTGTLCFLEVYIHQDVFNTHSLFSLGVYWVQNEKPWRSSIINILFKNIDYTIDVIRYESVYSY